MAPNRALAVNTSNTNIPADWLMAGFVPARERPNLSRIQVAPLPVTPRMHDYQGWGDSPQTEWQEEAPLALPLPPPLEKPTTDQKDVEVAQPSRIQTPAGPGPGSTANASSAEPQRAILLAPVAHLALGTPEVSLAQHPPSPRMLGTHAQAAHQPLKPDSPKRPLKATWSSLGVLHRRRTHDFRDRLPRRGSTASDASASVRSSLTSLSDNIDPIKALPPWKRRILLVVDGVWGASFMTLVTIWALFGDDLKFVTTYKDTDIYFLVLSGTCMVLFAIEITLASLARPKYFGRFFFWLDVVATASLVLDFPQTARMIAPPPLRERHEHLELGHALAGLCASSSTLSVVSDDSMPLAAFLVQHVMVLVIADRLVRVVQLYRLYFARQRKGDVRSFKEVERIERSQQTRVGRKLSDLTTRRVVIGVLMMLFAIPLFRPDLYWATPDANAGGLQLLHEVYVRHKPANATYAEFMQSPAGSTYQTAQLEFEGQNPNLLLLVVDGYTVFSDPYLNHLRPQEVQKAIYLTSTSVLDMRSTSQLTSGLDMARTFFICLLLGGGALLFSKDANNLVLMPIERMVKKVRDMAENPLAKTFLEAEAQRVKEQSGEPGVFDLETTVLERSINKICSLLAIGFGDAGAEIVGENMKNGGDLNPMVPGKKMVAIFGFCDIRQFTDTTEVLQADIMEFVNSIARIVHMEVHLHGGSANKNIGDAFLLVWKFPKTIDAEALAQPSLAERRLMEKVADNALASFLVIMASLRKSVRLKQYALHPGMRSRFETDSWEAKMGFGLHVGWAIEGAIGSEYKIDASYLSPNVNMASRLEAATKQFGTPLLMSEDFYKILSVNGQARCRQIDRVTVKGKSTLHACKLTTIHGTATPTRVLHLAGSHQPMGLFTYDVNVDAIRVLDHKDDVMTPTGARLIDSPSFAEFKDEFSEHPDLVRMNVIHPEFYLRFRQGLQAYLAGDWSVAREVLRECEYMRRDAKAQPLCDGPTLTLLNAMAEHGFVAPAAWAGFRELTEK
eukprot:jgi/Chlat1/7252/Chrsp58S06894